MCGIVGYKGKRKACNILLECIKTLEYRGYDSVGIATLANDQFQIKKDIGKIDEVHNKLNFLTLQGNLGVAHTRWSTHGGVTQINAHPHLSQDKKVAVVHNGIVENYQELKHELEKHGIKFISQTDTEIFPQYISYSMKQGKSFKDAVHETLLRVEGSYAIVAVNVSGEMIVARNGSPLVLGIGKDEIFAASDVPAFLEHTNKVVYLDDEEYAVLDLGNVVDSSKNYEVYNVKTNKKIKKEIKTITWTLEQAKKGNYPHFMLKEITEQKETIKKAIEQDHELIAKVTDAIKNAHGVFFVGCGTSYHACVSASYIFAHVAKRHVNVVLASEFRNHENFLKKETLVVAVSQSGETADLLDAVKTAKAHGCKTIAIVNVMGSTLTRLCDTSVMMNSGPEICVLSTKSYTSQLALLLLFAYSSAGRLEDGKKIINSACKHVDKVIDVGLEKLKPLAEKLHKQHDFFLIGRDLAYPSALEGALKIKEVSYIHAEGFAGAELKHGTIALIEKGVPCIALITKSTRKLILSNAMEVKARNGYIIGVSDENNEVFDYFIQVPAAGDADPILMIIPLQILAYYLALAKGLDVDKPRNLAKSVVVR
ncbi:glutamine--fructose-6-phosphate transaminase (isomerizing) [Candidatus Woesearchaeota archaeon]|nr:glutamine--fructose-6-phosphate transaminase (isomerizing) [Candidatus Woesearchaeota archaeon]